LNRKIETDSRMQISSKFGNPCVFFGKFDNPDYDFQTCEVASYHMQYFYRFEMKKS